ncbi:MAG: XRE family transcriptional regulator [Deltaproteobacteria bacterium HGW-Deltaproteobacteria-15]|jgi:transcriptional regulator with XRE-family HTH domain|nr:MAG: XRE family transcriptional regulator [Deltaproteobacteria bacterium HGW-Deltaproteobacteria-15]
MAGKSVSQPFAKRVMKLRKERNMTLLHLANETGLSPAFLAQIEKGEVIPPVSAILQISRALEIDSGVLLKEEKEKAGSRSAEDYEKRTEAYSYQNLTPEAKHKHLKAFKIHVEPKSLHKGVSYQHQGEEFVYVLKGKMEVMVGENKNILSPGQSLHFNSTIVHKMRNISSVKAELLVVLYTP